MINYKVDGECLREKKEEEVVKDFFISFHSFIFFLEEDSKTFFFCAAINFRLFHTLCFCCFWEQSIMV